MTIAVYAFLKEMKHTVRRNAARRRKERADLEAYMKLRGWSMDDLAILLVYKGVASFRDGRELTQEEIDFCECECTPAGRRQF